MGEMILISKSQYMKMLESYDQVIKELEETKKALSRIITAALFFLWAFVV